MSTTPLNGFGGAKSGDAPASDAVHERLVVCSSSSTILTKAKWPAVRGRWQPRKPTAIRQLLTAKVGPPVMVGQSRDVKLECAVERPAP